MLTIIIDLDGICFNPAERLNRCKKDDGTIDWDRAFSNSEVMQDSVIAGAAEAVFSIADIGFGIIYLTGRGNRCLKATWDALYNNQFVMPSYDVPMSCRLEMRDYDDVRPDNEIKEERIKWLKMLPLNEPEKYYDLVAAVDDDYNGTLKPMYEALGIPCFTSFKEFFSSEASI